ncbi:LysR family transcriptional regulator [Actinosynnema sp. NPDC020468]|uniref:LysR family transcriptional regulator n=1 Tax=Actinosynnema sp. NPDC020468 TaxID=3154488 RepID=UPI0033D50E4D
MMRDFDLNLVRTFVLLYETRSVTATAEAMHLTQPTISYSLQKLRRRFEDPLFRRAGGTLVPTTTASDLYEPLRLALSGIEAAVSGAHAFDPTAHHRFTLCLSDLGELALLPLVLSALATHAPNVTLTIRPLDVTDAADQLGRGDIDAFIASPMLSTPRVARVPLFAEGYLGLVSNGHPRLRGEVDLPALAAERHIAVFGPTGHDGPRKALEAHGLLDRVAVEITRFATLPYLVRDSELVAMAPRLIADLFADRHDVRLFDLPLHVEPVQVSIYARHSHARSPAQRWLVDFLRATLT